MSLTHYIGVDIAKGWIDVFNAQSGSAARRISTDPRALNAFAAGLSGQSVVFEASGGYERPLAEALAMHNVTYTRVNPRQSREFARATGRLAKTDKVDAQVLAHMGTALALKPTIPPRKACTDLADMMARGDDIKAMMTAENNRLAQARLPCIRRNIKSTLTHLDKCLTRIEAEISRHIAADDNLRQTSERLQTMPGLGPILERVALN